MRGIEELDHYELLEIGRRATLAEIGRAYRTAQQTYAEGSLALYSVFESMDARAIRDRLDDAYRVLADSELRSQYDGSLTVEVPAFSDSSQVSGDSNQEVSDRSETLSESDSEIQLDLRTSEASGARTLDDAVEEYGALEDDGRGEFDGTRLRRNRLFRGYEISDIAEVTKVSSSHLRNIEDEHFEYLPADVYVRGFVTAYARTIGLDPKIVVPSYMARVQEARDTNQRGRFLGRR